MTVGRLYLDPSVANDCAAACDELIDGLGAVAQLSDDGPYSIGDVLRQHQDVIGLIRAALCASVSSILATDDDCAVGMARVALD